MNGTIDVILVLHTLGDDAWSRQKAGIMRYAESRGWAVRFVKAKSINSEIESAARDPVTAGVISSLGVPLSPDVFSSIPTVYFDCRPSVVPDGSPYLCHDAKWTAHIAARELFTLKRASFAFAGFSYPDTGEIPPWSVSREEAFAGEVAKRNGAFAGSFMPRGKSAAKRLSAMSEWLSSLPKPCGVFAVNDATAALVRTCALDLGLRIPSDVAIVGVDNDLRFCLGPGPGLTSVVPDWEGGGYAAASALGDLIDGRIVDPQQTFRPIGVVRRESTARVNVRMDSRIENAIALIRSRACSGIRVPDVVDTLRSSRRFAEKYFREVTGASILEEIRRVRFDNAKVMLSRSAISIETVAHRSGYSSIPSFCREFKQLAGVSPTAWRQKERAVRSAKT